MNKIPLLEKFAAQSLVYVDTGLSDGKELIFSKEKFAELIVRECIVDFYRRYLDVNSNEDITVQVERYVKEHFGVEE